MSIAADKDAVDGRCRILYLIDGLEGDGAERQLCELVKGVHRLDEYDPHVAVLEENENGHAWIIEELGLTINVFARRSRFDLSPIRRIVRYIREQHIDIVHTYMSMGSEFGLIAGKICRVPVITSSIRNGMNRDWREAVRTFYQSRFADLAVANSHAGFTSRFKTMRDTYRVIHNGFDLGRFRFSTDDDAALRRELTLPEEAPLICMAARMEPQKDHATLLTAMRTLLARHPTALLLLAGQGTLQQQLESRAHELEIADSVRFLGHRRDVEHILSICDASALLTSTDIHKEGISNTIIESMAVGTPVIATRGGGTDEILSEADAGNPPYEHGIKVDAYDASQVADGLDFLLSNPAASAEIAARAREMVLRRFNLDRFIAENVALYREIRDAGALRDRTTGT